MALVFCLAALVAADEAEARIQAAKAALGHLKKVMSEEDIQEYMTYK